MVRSVVRRGALSRNGTGGIELAGSARLCGPTEPRLGLCPAQEILEQAGEKFPDCATIHFNLACYAAQLGNLPEARLRLRRAVQLDQVFAARAKTDPDLKAIQTEME